jgi:hypothetical protein
VRNKSLLDRFWRDSGLQHLDNLWNLLRRRVIQQFSASFGLEAIAHSTLAI